MSRLAVTLVVLLVLLAGCSGFAGGDDPPDREPYAVDERVNASVEDDPEELLTGLTTEGVTNASGLRETHREAIANASYTVEIETEYVIENENGTSRRTRGTELRVDSGAEVVHEVTHHRFEGPSTSSLYTTDGPNQTVERWFGEETVFRTEFENGSVEYTTWDERTWAPATRIEQASTQPLAPLQNAGETTTAGMVEAEDGTYYVVESEDNASGDELGPNQQEREMEARTLVREDGLVRHTVAEETIVTEDGTRIVIAHTTEVTAVGETEVERPDWYEEAIAVESDVEAPGEDSANETAVNDTDDGSNG